MDVLTIIYEVIDEMNEQSDGKYVLDKREETVVFGAGSTLDSLGLVNLITALEMKLEESTGRYISIADERALSMTDSPFRTVRSLKDYVTRLLDEE